MIGQVAALRGQVTTIAELHDDVSAGEHRRCVGRLAAAGRDRDRPPDRDPGPVDVAIVGMAVDLPGRVRRRRVLGEHRRGRERDHARCPPSAGTSDRYFDPDAATTSAPAARRLQVGRLPRRDRRSIRSPTASRRRRSPPSSRCSCCPSRSRAARSPTPATPTASSTARGPRSSSAPRPAPTSPAPTASARCCPQLLGDAAARARRLPAGAHRGLLPRRADQRDRRAASPTGSTSAASTTPSTPPARRRSPRSTSPARSSSPAPATWCSAAAPTCTTASTTT